MVVTHDPRPPYREDLRDAYSPPPRNMLDTASAFWVAVVAALAAGLLIWMVYGSIQSRVYTASNVTPSVATQPTTPAVPATRPAPTP